MNAATNIERMNQVRMQLIRTVADEARRQEELAGRPDGSGYESYGKIKDRLEKATKAFKPMEKTLKEYWEVVSGDDEDLQASFLRELQTEAEAVLTELARLAAAVSRAAWALTPYEPHKIGQMTMDELTEPWEIPDPEGDLPAAEEVLGSDE